MIDQERSGDVVTLCLNHGKANAIDIEMLQALSAILQEHADAGALVLTGNGSIFSAGVDLKRMLAGGPDYVAEFVPLLDRVLRELFAYAGPLVTAVNGHAIAGGCIFGLCGDYRLMAAGRGRIGAPELTVSVPFPAAPLEILRFALPRAVMQHHLYRGETLQPEEAEADGFIDEVCAAEELLPRAQDIAAELASIPAENFRLAKRMLRGPTLERMRDGDERHNPAVYARWADPETLAGIDRYLAALGG